MIRKMTEENIENVAGGFVFCKNGIVIEGNENWKTFLDFLNSSKDNSKSRIEIQTQINENSKNLTKAYETIKKYSTDGHIDGPIFIKLDPKEIEAFSEYYFST